MYNPFGYVNGLTLNFPEANIPKDKISTEENLI